MPTNTLAYSEPAISDRSVVSRAQAEQLVIRLAQIFLAAWLCSYLVSGLRAAFWFNGYPVNGPFQLYDPLRRLAAGQHAGTDFQFFHGIGIPFLHYPLFWLFGGHSLTAAELSRQFTSLLLFVGSLGAFLWAVYRNSPILRLRGRVLRSPFVAAAVLILLLEQVFPRGAEPGHSLVSGRSTMPLLAFALLQLRLNRWLKALLTGCVIAGAFTFGTEHGISLTLALFGITALSTLQALFLRKFDAAWENIRFVSLALASALITGCALFVSFCGLDGARRALHFNLVELPADQFWFFGSPPMPYLTSLWQLLFNRHVVLCFLPSLLLLALLAGIVSSRWRRPLRLASDWGALAALMLTYGVLTAIPLIGILSRHYVFPQARIFLLVSTLALAHGFGAATIGRIASRRLAGRWSVAALAGALFVAAAAGTSLLLLFRSAQSATQTVQHWRQPASFSRSLDDHWNAFMTGATRVIDTHRVRPQLTLWSEYAALLDAHYGTFQPAEDYIIHSVGQERWKHYLETFRQTNPEFVTTMTSQFSFAEWLQDERWEFYEDLVDNYLPLENVEHATIWQRRPGNWVEAGRNYQALPLSSGGDSVTIPGASAGATGIVVLRIRYQVRNPWKKLPLIGATPRYLAAVEGTPRHMPISFPPYCSSFQFPVKLAGSAPVTIHFHTESFLPGAQLHVESAEMRVLPRNPASAVLFAARRIPSRY